MPSFKQNAFISKMTIVWLSRAMQCCLLKPKQLKIIFSKCNKAEKKDEKLRNVALASLS